MDTVNTKEIIPFKKNNIRNQDHHHKQQVWFQRKCGKYKEIKSMRHGTLTTWLSWCAIDQLNHQIQNFTPFSRAFFWETKQRINLEITSPELQKQSHFSKHDECAHFKPYSEHDHNRNGAWQPNFFFEKHEAKYKGTHLSSALKLGIQRKIVKRENGVLYESEK